MGTKCEMAEGRMAGQVAKGIRFTFAIASLTVPELAQRVIARSCSSPDQVLHLSFS